MRLLLVRVSRARGAQGCWVGIALAGALVLFPQGATADATIEAGPVASRAPGLPDGRVYEQVSPPNKSGAQAGGSIGLNRVNGEGYPALASADGEAIFYWGFPQGPAALSGLESRQIARRRATGWQQMPAAPRPVTIKSVNEAIGFIDPAADLSHVWFTAPAPFVAPDDPAHGVNIYRAGEDPLKPPVWLAKPTIANPMPAMGSVNTNFIEPAGGAPDLSTVYFAYYGTLIAADAPRAPYVEETADDRGLYEWTEVAGLAAAGLLPDGSESPFGAAPAGESDLENRIGPDIFDNQVSKDGSRAFFVSPDPMFPSLGTTCNAGNSGSGGCAPELYVREGPSGARHTTLISRDTTISGKGGSASAMAPDGVLAATVPGGITENSKNKDLEDSPSARRTSVYASPDGSHAFFESVDALTPAAPSDGTPKEYDFDTTTDSLRFLAGVTDGAGGTAAVIALAPEGSRVLFARMEGAAVLDLELWSDGPGGGTVSRVSALPSVPFGAELTHVSAGRTSADGSVFLFTSNSPLPGGFNNLAPGRAANVEEVYRYDAANNTLSCVSCPPPGILPTSSARVSVTEEEATLYGLVRDRGMSADGSRVFFDTGDPLVPRDTNGMRDVYQWENGVVSLVSAGSGPGDSLIMDSSEDGSDVFFATTDGLSGADTDGEYDVYDARIPRGSDTMAASVEACAGETCQPPALPPSLLGAPATASPSGAGNITPAPVATQTRKGAVKKKAKAKKRSAKKTKTRRHKARRAARGGVGRNAGPGGRGR